MQPRITIIGIGVNDLSRANDFYINTLGWKKTESSNDDITFIELNGLLLSLYPIDKLGEDATVELGDPTYRPVTFAQNLTSEEEVDLLFKELDAKGVSIIKKPQKVFWGGYSGYFADPDGNLWEVAYNPYLVLDEEGNIS